MRSSSGLKVTPLFPRKQQNNLFLPGLKTFYSVLNIAFLDNSDERNLSVYFEARKCHNPFENVSLVVPQNMKMLLEWI